MSRGPAPTGHVTIINGRWHVRVTDHTTGKRPYLPLPEDISPTEAERAKRIGAAMARKYREGGIALAHSPETVDEWFGRFFEEREKAGLTTVRNDRSRYKNHVQEVIGKLPMTQVSKYDLMKLVRSLDEKVRGRKLSWKTAANVWAIVTKGFSTAKVGSKPEFLNVRDDDPTRDVQGPDGGAPKSKAYLYPSEFLQLVACEEVPLRWRHVFAVAVYLYARRGELAALRVGDVDLVRGIIHIHSSEGENGGEIKATKTGSTRRVPIEKPLLPLLKVLCEGRKKTDFVLDMPWEDRLSTGLRDYLKRAGVDRPELFAPSDDLTRKNITFHDLRATGITWCAVRGDDALKIRSRAGHSDFQMTQKYIREAENLRDIDFGEVFPELPASLLTPESSNQPSNLSVGSITVAHLPRIIAGTKCEGGDLNPGKGASNREVTSIPATLGRPFASTSGTMSIDDDGDFEGQLMAMLGATSR